MSFLKTSTDDDFDKIWCLRDSPRIGDKELSAELLVDTEDTLLRNRLLNC